MTTPVKPLPTARICVECNQTFAPTSHWQTICSPECKAERQRARWRTKERRSRAGRAKPRHCLHCGNLFIPTIHRLRLCSDRCVRERTKEREKLRDRSMAAYLVRHDQERGRRAPSRYDCSSYDDCLTKAARLGAASTPCADCAQYQHEDIRASGPLSSASEPPVGLAGCGEGNRRRGIR